MTTLYGIKNCDTIKKARKWLADNNIEHVFHDYRQDGLEESWLRETEAALGWEALLNKRGTTFRQLDEADKQDLNRDKAIALMLANPAMIKRPVLIHQGQYLLGFKAPEYAAVLS
ncbi:ArsC family reductase [Aestuariibacter halophilus]|uniref:ArsC family reductase n=1 Tax=Fluctibacter halophilus TaxID=226011 RepID=A0ABS8G673_9ALTE|nr:ArsC family reductase [Aestuariibacter halophilus]MCC2615994.1 ArsC family reductase [Aestuariibacter halophilus]